MNLIQFLFRTCRGPIGAVTLAAGSHTLAVKPRTKPGAAVMDLRQVTLLPALP